VYPIELFPGSRKTDTEKSTVENRHSAERIDQACNKKLKIPFLFSHQAIKEDRKNENVLR